MTTAADAAELARLEKHRENPAVQKQLALLQWSADFADRNRALEYASRMVDPWFDINFACNAEIGNELKREWREPELIAECRMLPVPTLIVDGAQDIRPRWGVDSLAAGLPNVRRLTLTDAGHLPWFESPEPFYQGVTEFLNLHR